MSSKRNKNGTVVSYGTIEPNFPAQNESPKNSKAKLYLVSGYWASIIVSKEIIND
jgi:hypothetical protein